MISRLLSPKANCSFNQKPLFCQEFFHSRDCIMIECSVADVVFVNCVDFDEQDNDEAKINQVNIFDYPRSNARGTGTTVYGDLCG